MLQSHVTGLGSTTIRALAGDVTSITATTASTQATSIKVPSSICVVLFSDPADGVVMPPGDPGDKIYILLQSGGGNVFPPLGGRFQGLAPNQVTIVNQNTLFIYTTSLNMSTFLG